MPRLELVPYRKDDSFSRDFPLYGYVAQRRFLAAKSTFAELADRRASSPTVSNPTKS
ncbi:MAG: hypothetical protein ABI877_09520 [Gemmatimonadaceae bacterium]